MMKTIAIRFCALIAALSTGCSGDSIEDRFGYGKEPAYTFGIAGLRVVSYSSKVATFEYDFVLYDESGIVNEEKFDLGLDKIVFSGSTTELDFDLESLITIDADPRGCYDVAVLFEHNAMERPDRMEVAARTIFKETPQCSNYVFSWYPERDKALDDGDDIKIEGNEFLNDPFAYDQVLAQVSYGNRTLFQRKTTPELTQHEALAELIQFTAVKSDAENKQILVLYENNDDDDAEILDEITQDAIDNGIVLNAVRSDYAENDFALIAAVNATGGLYCYQDDTDFWHERNKSDAYAFARNADEFFSGNYKVYRATYRVNTNKTFSSGYWFRVNLPISLPNDVEKSLPIYVTLD